MPIFGNFSPICLRINFFYFFKSQFFFSSDRYIEGVHDEKVWHLNGAVCT